ncbi:MAG TPA: hypothetical protein VKX96_11680 [Chloroflexota bacterium]|nr:hypothetical protein [Chloroflexota bacterium]
MALLSWKIEGLLRGLSQIELATTMMDRQINELVDAARLRIARSLLSPRSINLVKLIREMIDAHQRAFNFHGSTVP